jgi:hypothetical protein
VVLEDPIFDPAEGAEGRNAFDGVDEVRAERLVD